MGIGILSLPAGVAEGTGLIPAMIILVLMYLATWSNASGAMKHRETKCFAGRVWQMRPSWGILPVLRRTGVVDGFRCLDRFG